MERAKAAALRRVAIVLSSLPEATASKLLGDLDAESQRAVGRALRELDDVDPLEQRRALDGFARSVRQRRSPLAGQNDAAEVVFSQVALQRGDRPATGDKPASGGADPEGRFAFLRDCDDDQLAATVRGEHPQTIAIILASLAPRKAATLLPKLGVVLRSDVMQRLAKLQRPAPEIVDEIASHLKQQLQLAQAAGAGSTQHWPATASQADGPTSMGQAALQAILQEMPQQPPPAAAQTPQPSSEHDAVMQAYARAVQPSQQRASGPIDLATPTQPANRPAGNDVGIGRPQQRRERGPGEPSADQMQTDLVLSSPQRLREALASIDARQALLAMLGLPTATAEAVLGSLPKRQARKIRQQLNTLDGVQLRQIDVAKRTLWQTLQRQPAGGRTATAATPARRSTAAAA